MFERSAEVLPEWRVLAGIVGGEKQTQHKEQTEGAGGAHQQTRDERQSDRQFTVSDKKGERRRVWQDEVLQNRLHEGIRAVFEKAVDPELKAAVQGELRAEDFVLGENEKERADCDAQYGQC